MKIEITEEDREWLLERAVQKILYGQQPNGDDDESEYHGGLDKELNRRLQAKLDGLATKKFEEAVHAEVSTRVKAIIDEGWQGTTPWGERTGDRMTIRQMVVAKLESKVGGDYKRPGKTLIQHLVHEAVEGALGKELRAEIERAKGEIRAAVDGLIKEKLAETLRAALGMGR